MKMQMMNWHKTPHMMCIMGLDVAYGMHLSDGMAKMAIGWSSPDIISNVSPHSRVLSYSSVPAASWRSIMSVCETCWEEESRRRESPWGLENTQRRDPMYKVSDRAPASIFCNVVNSKDIMHSSQTQASFLCRFGKSRIHRMLILNSCIFLPPAPRHVLFIFIYFIFFCNVKEIINAWRQSSVCTKTNPGNTKQVKQMNCNLNSVFTHDPTVPGVIAQNGELKNQHIVSAFCLFLSVLLIKYLTGGPEATNSHYPARIISPRLK